MKDILILSKDTIMFSVILLLTIVVVRLILHFTRIKSPTIKGYRMHHFHYGILMMVVGTILQSVPLFSIGYGFYVDEKPCIFHYGSNFGYKEYSSLKSIKSVFIYCLFSVIIFCMMDTIILELNVLGTAAQAYWRFIVLGIMIVIA